VRETVSVEYLYGSIENAEIGACIKMTHFRAAENFIQIKDIVNFAPQRSDGVSAIACRPRLYALPTW
jgi:hypothetical protein